MSESNVVSNEIERKFLLSIPLNDLLALYPGLIPYIIEQRYLSENGKWTTRVRRTCHKNRVLHEMAFKKKITNIECGETEDEISSRFYEKMTLICGPALHKWRYKIGINGHVWEVDHFLNPELNNLVVAEIELKRENEIFTKPSWIGEEVSDDKYYKCKNLARLIS
jgi:adenylate cyclase